MKTYQMEADHATLCVENNTEFLNRYGPENRNPLVVITNHVEIPLFILFSSTREKDLTAADEVEIYNCCMKKSTEFRHLFLKQKWKPLMNGNRLTVEKQLMPGCPMIMICDVPVFTKANATYPDAYIVKHPA